ncbi:hypothetical protein F8E02_03810 [Methanoculleus sp. Wushi-C6]|uniref:Uncharacterized protein n=1 Tax=Methanoculleus caldifontis TaxID=2651577 RepID=A0ABU3WZD2_9EURY|nr:hypothetical protein [Methanoculleus sp. Wushi-C6]MDV2481149.1 hypothetical protein [Methanoculleus sp. Wushi-C6]
MRVRQILVLLLLLALAAPASAIPALPAEFSGTVTIDGSPAPAGTAITARIGDRDCGSLTLVAAGAFGGEGIYDNRLIVNGEDSDAGKTIIFLVGGIAAGSAVYTPGTSTTIALAATGGTAPGGSSGSSSGGSGGSGSGPSTTPSATPSATPTPTATVTEPAGTDTPDAGEEGAVRQETPALAATTTVPLADPTLTFGPVVSAVAVQQAGLPFSWLAGLAALAGAACLARTRKG